MSAWYYMQNTYMYIFLFNYQYMQYFAFLKLQSVEKNDQNSPVNNQTSTTVKRPMLDEQKITKLNWLKYLAIQH